MFVRDEKKRRSNLLKHRFDFAQANLVYHNPGETTRRTERDGEARYADTAFVESYGIHLTLVYTKETATSALSPYATLQERRDWIIRNSTSETDWEHIFKMRDSDAPIPYDPNDDDEPYDPNDGTAVQAFWRHGVRDGLVTRGIGKDAVVLKPEDFEWGRQEARQSSADEIDTLTP